MFDNHFTAESEHFTVAPQSVVPQCPLSVVHLVHSPAVCWLLQFWLLAAAGRGLVRRNPRIPTVHSIVEATRAERFFISAHKVKDNQNICILPILYANTPCQS